MKFSAAL